MNSIYQASEVDQWCMHKAQSLWQPDAQFGHLFVSMFTSVLYVCICRLSLSSEDYSVARLMLTCGWCVLLFLKTTFLVCFEGTELKLWWIEVFFFVCFFPPFLLAVKVKFCAIAVLWINLWECVCIGMAWILTYWVPSCCLTTPVFRLQVEFQRLEFWQWFDHFFPGGPQCLTKKQPIKRSLQTPTEWCPLLPRGI